MVVVLVVVSGLVSSVEVCVVVLGITVVSSGAISSIELGATVVETAVKVDVVVESGKLVSISGPVEVVVALVVSEVLCSVVEEGGAVVVVIPSLDVNVVVSPRVVAAVDVWVVISPGTVTVVSPRVVVSVLLVVAVVVVIEHVGGDPFTDGTQTSGGQQFCCPKLQNCVPGRRHAASVIVLLAFVMAPEVVIASPVEEVVVGTAVVVSPSTLWLLSLSPAVGSFLVPSSVSSLTILSSKLRERGSLRLRKVST